MEEMRMEQRPVREPPGSEYTYDVGKHRGKTFRQVEAEDAEYAAWCMVSGMHIQHPTWRDALVAADLWEIVSQRVDEMRMEQMAGRERPTTEYTYDFGKHRGKTLRQVEAEDAGYAAWCMMTGCTLGVPTGVMRWWQPVCGESSRRA